MTTTVCKKSKEFVMNYLFFDLHCEKNEGGSKILVLRGNDLVRTGYKRITDADLIKVTAYLRERPNIVALDLAYNEITSCGITTLADYFIEKPVIRHLNVMGNNIGGRGVNYLANLGDKLCLYSLRLTGNKIGDEGGKFLYELLCKNTRLKFLDLSDTHQTMAGLAYIMTALMPNRGGSKTLEYIDLGRPLPERYQQINDAHAAEFVVQVLQDNKSLKEIHLQQYQFDFRDMELLLEGLLLNNTLVCLDLNNNCIADDGVDYLCKYLKTNPPLECLMIGANNISDLGALSLSFSLPFSQIKLLDLSNNHITDKGMINIFYTIKKKVKLRSLFFWGNKLTHTSLVVLHRLYQSKLLDPEHTDVTLYCVDKEFHATWNYMANRYTHRFYCVSDEESRSLKLKINPGSPVEKPPIYYKYHVDNKDIGFPMCEWPVKQARYLDFGYL